MGWRSRQLVEARSNWDGVVGEFLSMYQPDSRQARLAGEDARKREWGRRCEVVLH